MGLREFDTSRGILFKGADVILRLLNDAMTSGSYRSFSIEPPAFSLSRPPFAALHSTLDAAIAVSQTPRLAVSFFARPKSDLLRSTPERFLAAGVAGVAGTVALVPALCYHTYGETGCLSGEGLPPVGLPFVL